MSISTGRAVTYAFGELETLVPTYAATLRCCERNPLYMGVARQGSPRPRNSALGDELPSAKGNVTIPVSRNPTNCHRSCRASRATGFLAFAGGATFNLTRCEA